MGCTNSHHKNCGMRRPSLVQTEDDLSRLTSVISPTNGSLTSSQTDNGTSNNNNLNNNNNASSYLPNIINSSEWQNCRKRKERQDSTSSIIQDRKLVRSNSEEHLPNCQEVIRRVSSHEDFKKPSPLNEITVNNIIHETEEQNVIEKNQKNSSDNLNKSYNESENIIKNSLDVSKLKAESHNQSHKTRLSPNRDTRSHGRKDNEDFEGEHERRRNSERFSKTRPPSGRKSASPRKPSKQVIKCTEKSNENVYKYDANSLKHEKRGFISKKEKSIDDKHENDIISDYNDNNLLDSNNVATKSAHETLPWDQSFQDDTPVVCPRFADHTFNHVNNMDQFGKIRNVPPTNELKSYGSFLSSENVKSRDSMLQKIIPPTNNMFLTPDERIKQINKKLNTLKKKVTQYEENFEKEYGYRPSHADKTSDKSIKNAIVEIHKLRKEKSQIKTDPMSAMGYKTPSNSGLSEDKKLCKMKETLLEIEKRLKEKRDEDSRCDNLDTLSSEELVDEKAAVQRGLLYLESIFGRPNTRDERDAARPLYDRYRLIKRLVNRNNSLVGSGGIAELPTILEHEALAITGTATPSTDITPPSATSVVQSPSDTSASVQSTDDSTETTSSSITENVQAMSVDELWEHYDVTREEKKELRRSIKEFEHEFEEANGRKMLKSDRKFIEETYALYKQKKAKLRLLDALVKKQMAA